MHNTCPFCEVGHLSEVVHSDEVKAGRSRVTVHGLVKLVCGECGHESVPLELLDQNSALIERTLAETRAAVSRGLLRRLREMWGLSQKEASVVFGAGVSSFAKWESGQAKLSTPSALLVQCALRFPVVVPYLASLAKVHLREDAFAESSDGGWRAPKIGQVLCLYGSGTASANLPKASDRRWTRSYSYSVAANSEYRDAA